MGAACGCWVDSSIPRRAPQRYYLLEATRADLLRRNGDRVAAAAAYERAVPLAASDVERRYLLTRLKEVGTGSEATGRG